MNKHVILILLSVLYTGLGFAQVKTSDIVFDSKNVDFGDIFVENGIVTAKYKFTNNSSNKFIIRDIDAACGCTNPRSSKDTFAPGESGTISAEFNPKGMLGQVSKWVYVRGVFTDGYQIELNFDANIKSIAQRNTGAYFRGEFGYLLVDRIALAWGSRDKTTSFSDSITLTNDGYNNILVKRFDKSPSFIKGINFPISIAAGESKVLHIEINLAAVDTIGSYSDQLNLITTDKFFPKKQISYAVNFEENFDNWEKKDKKKAAHIKLSTDIVQMGKLKSGGIKTKTITISNTGKSPLKLLRIDTDCSCALLTTNKKVLQPNETMTVSVRFDSLYKEGTQSKVISIYTNDPVMPIQKIIVKSEVI